MVENQNREVAIQLQGVKKKYRLGQIGGGTLQGDLQSWWARLRGKEDPNSKIGTDQQLVGKTFMALNGIDLTVYKGEALGIIGHNGAGKSTLLKLLSRVTAPTEGEIDIYGRITSMLEVGTGFNGEMTGRENIYMNGAILGMTKAEIDAKMEEIIEFSEVREFIDTPVKRYSSGMYVKLAFSVAAHLDSEIMIMDEVLAVGDMAFQKKCLNKMRDAAKLQGRTVLYVSHNMNTIRQLCERVVVLDKGKLVFDGAVEEGIEVYLSVSNSSQSDIDLSVITRWAEFDSGLAKMTRLMIENANGIFNMNSTLKGELFVHSNTELKDNILKITLFHNSQAIITSESKAFDITWEGETKPIHFEMNLKGIAPALYSTKIVLCRRNEFGVEFFTDVILEGYMFRIVEPKGFMSNKKWNRMYSGFFVGEEIDIDVGS